MSDTIKKLYAIEGMHCKSCAMSIDWELEDVPGIADARTSYTDNRTEVMLDPDVVSDDDVLAAIARAGFEARPA